MNRRLIPLGLACATLLAVSACDRCESIDPSALLGNSDVVFRGRVERIRYPGDGRPPIVTFQIAQSWKGQPPGQVQLEGMRRPENGGEYLVFANRASGSEPFVPRAMQAMACAKDAVASLEAKGLADLAAAEARWAAGKPASYEFVVEVSCFCAMQRPPPSFRVTGSRSEPLQPFDDPRLQLMYERYDTVEKVFAAIRRAIEDGADGVHLRYDATLGYPILADFDFSVMAADEELSLRIVELRPIP